jgi:hypothetical protein
MEARTMEPSNPYQESRDITAYLRKCAAKGEAAHLSPRLTAAALAQLRAVIADLTAPESESRPIIDIVAR